MIRPTLVLAVLLLPLAAPSAVRAEPIGLVTNETPPAQPPTSFSFSQARVTPDPTYPRHDFLDKWPHVSLDEAKRLQALPGVVFVDGRSYSEWAQSHIPGALALPVGEFDKRFAMQRGKLLKAKMLISYCHGTNCTLSERLAQELVDQGFRNVAVFWGGFPAWKDAGLPLLDKNGKTVGAAKAPTAQP